MSSIVNLRVFASTAAVPTVVFVDLQQEYQAAPRLLAIRDIDGALANCRRVLDHARRIGLPIAFVRRSDNSPFFNRTSPLARWIEGFEPDRHEMIFERSHPSCYASEPFASFMSQCAGGIVLCGFAGESACLSTMVDAHHRHQRAIFLADASASHDLDDLDAAQAHRAVSKICGLYGDVCDTQDWIAATLPRHIGVEKNASG